MEVFQEASSSFCVHVGGGRGKRSGAVQDMKDIECIMLNILPVAVLYFDFRCPVYSSVLVAVQPALIFTKEEELLSELFIQMNPKCFLNYQSVFVSLLRLLAYVCSFRLND